LGGAQKQLCMPSLVGVYSKYKWFQQGEVMTKNGTQSPGGGTSSGGGKADGGGKTPDDHGKHDSTKHDSTKHDGARHDGARHDGAKGGAGDTQDGAKGAGGRPSMTENPSGSGRGNNPAGGKKE
jgi:hypothetical protein